MSRLTGSDALGLFEAYQAVYAPQELTEEQVWEEVENWVNSLIEEGYDLSDYTWEEMYEAYVQLHEVDMTGKEVGALNRAQNPLKPPTKGKVDFSGKEVGSLNRRQLSVPLVDEYIKEAPVRPTLKGAAGNKELYQNRLTAFIQGAQAVRGGSRVRPTLAGAGGDKQLYQNRLGAFIQGAQAAKVKKTEPKGDDGRGRGGDTRLPAAARPARPAPAKSSSGTSPTVPKSGPASTPTSTMPTAERRTPTSAELRAAQGARKSALEAGKTKPEAEKSAVQAGIDRGTKLMGGPEGPGKIDTSSVQRDLARANAPKPTPTATPTPSATKPSPSPANKARGSSKPGSIVSSFDLFDVVMGHLLDEGYADTEESALAIMANMSEEWRESIVEGVGGYDDPVAGPHTPIGKAARSGFNTVKNVATKVVNKTVPPNIRSAVAKKAEEITSGRYGPPGSNY